MYDLIINNAVIVDGSGEARRHGSVAVQDGRIAAVGDVVGRARRSIDADGRVVAPGFIDIHTHYDAQALWDPWLTPSCLHGVTTAIGGNCGFTAAPMRPEVVRDVIDLLGVVEAIPPACVTAGADFEWRSFGDYLDRLEGEVGINVGFLAGHSTIRRVVMGERALGVATAEDLAAMEQLLDESLAQGALGFSSSWAEAHAGAPSLVAPPEELVALSRVVARHPGTFLEFVPGVTPVLPPDRRRVMSLMSAAAGRCLNWNLISIRSDLPEEALVSRLSAFDESHAEGGAVFGLLLPVPTVVRHNFQSGFLLKMIPGFESLIALPEKERILALANDPAMRPQLAESAAKFAVQKQWADFASLTIESVGSDEFAPLIGRSIGEIAAERGVAPIDALFDIAAADELRTSLSSALIGDDDASWERRARYLNDPRVIIGGSDAGAHLDFLSTFALSTGLLSMAVRQRGLLDLETAVKLITDEPARFYGLADRGRIQEGWIADLVLFDPDTIDSEPLRFVDDFPGGVSRLFAGAIGVDQVLVSGEPIVEQGALTDSKPGKVIRSGRDTVTVPASFERNAA